MQIAFLIIKYSFIPLLIVLVYNLFIYRKLTLELKTLSWFIFFSAVIELVSRILWLNSRNNMPLLHLYVAGGGFLLALFYQRVLDGFISKKVIGTLTVIFLVITTINSLFIQGIYTFNSYGLTVEAIIVIILSLSTYRVMLNDIVRQNRMGLTKSLNWINSGLFIYYSSSLLIFYFGEVINHFFSHEASLYSAVLHSFFAAIMYLCFFIGLWHRPAN